ncbi:WD40/YVTN/BNR-like repeat-containing protein [Nannocystis pusilla]|uniref:WD40/YVTN/BNR-like repeat-containing protein n=1 Tax=Nannocystis pusilla TaxID=889268 RepID=UPI003BF1AEDA
MLRSARTSCLAGSLALAAAAGAALPGAVACNACDLYYQPVVWAAQVSPVEADLFAVAAAQGVVVAVGAGGAIARQAGEAAWTAPASATDASLRGVAFTRDETVVAVGDGGVVVRSTDAGETWAVIDAGVTDDLVGVTCSEEGTCVAVGDGVLRLSTDAGASWGQPAEVPAELGDLRAVAFDPSVPNAFIAVGLDGAVVLSEDGQTWTAMPGASADFQALATHAGRWVLAGADGAVFLLIDGEFVDESQFDTTTITGITRDGEWLVREDGVVISGSPFWYAETAVRTEEELPPLRAVTPIGDEAIIVGDGGLIGRARISDELECDRRFAAR